MGEFLDDSLDEFLNESLGGIYGGIIGYMKDFLHISLVEFPKENLDVPLKEFLKDHNGIHDELLKKSWELFSKESLDEFQK